MTTYVVKHGITTWVVEANDPDDALTVAQVHAYVDEECTDLPEGATLIDVYDDVPNDDWTIEVEDDDNPEVSS